MTDLITYFLNVGFTVADEIALHFAVEDTSALMLLVVLFIFSALLLSLSTVYKAFVYVFQLLGSVFFGGGARFK